MLTPADSLQDRADALLAWLLAAQQAVAMPLPVRKATPAPPPLWIVDARVAPLMRLYDIAACLAWLAGADGKVITNNSLPASFAENSGLPMVLLHVGTRTPEQWDAFSRVVPRLLVVASQDYTPAFGFTVMRLRADVDTARIDQLVTQRA